MKSPKVKGAFFRDSEVNPCDELLHSEILESVDDYASRVRTTIFAIANLELPKNALKVYSVKLDD